MNVNVNNNNILSEFRNKQDLYKQLDKTVYSRLKEIRKENSFFMMDIQHRVKDEKSLKTKLIRKGGKYKTLKEITDLVGFRIICYFSDTVDKVAASLSKYFVIDAENSVDKRAILQATQFGYLSLHYICTLSPSESNSGEICTIPFEIQIRTVLQHAWAEIEHDLGYKSEFGIPKPIRRDFSRIAGLLEIADNEFMVLRDNTRKYTEEVRVKIENDEGYDVSLDELSFNEFIYKSKKFQKFIKTIKEEFSIDVELIDINYTFLKQLEWIRIEKIGEFYLLFENNKDYALKQIKKIVESFGIDIIVSSAVLKFLVEGELLRSKYNEEQLRQFLSIDEKDSNQIERNIKRILEIKAEL